MNEFIFDPSSDNMNPLPYPWLKIDHFSCLSYRPYLQGIWHQHSLIEIIFIRSGSGYLHIGNHIIFLTADSLCLIPAYTLHYISAVEGTELNYYSIGYYESGRTSRPQPPDMEYVVYGWSNPVENPQDPFSLRLPEENPPGADDWSPTPLERDLSRLECSVIPDMNPLGYLSTGFELLNRLLCDPDRGKDCGELFQMTANNILYWIRHEALRRKIRPIAASKISIHALLKYISEHYSEDLQLITLAHEFGISPAQINRLFNKYCGMSPRNYIIYYRMTIAIRLLLQSELSISEITEQIGYQNQAHFAKLFHQYVGCSPSEFRDRYPDLLPL